MKHLLAVTVASCTLGVMLSSSALSQVSAETTSEMANESKAQMRKEGASLGGIVRSGAGIEFSKVGSLAEGALVEFDANTGVMMNGYPWFKITKYNDVGATVLSGYQWGGIMCSFDPRDGVYETCPRGWSSFEGGSDAANAKGGDPIAPVHGHGGEDEAVGEQPIAPAHGNSDEDNEMIALASITTCLETSKTGDGKMPECIGRVSDKCMEDANDYSTLGMRQCINLENSAWDSLLNKNYQALMVSLDTEMKKDKLRMAQRHWLRFVDSFCPLGYEFNQGTMYLVTGDQCRMEMTARQVLELRQLESSSNL